MVKALFPVSYIVILCNAELIFTFHDINQEILFGNKHYAFKFNKSGGERQLRVDTGLLCLQSLMPDDGICMMALTMNDLYAEVTDLFVAGIAQMKYRMGIFTLHR